MNFFNNALSKSFIFGLFFLKLGCISPNFAEQPMANMIQNIEIIGNQRIEKETIRAIADIEIGQKLSEEDLNRSLKNLFKAHYFLDIKMVQKGSTLFITVVENPVVNQLAFEGNDKISDEILKGELTLRPRQIYTQTRLRDDAQRVQDLYRLKGYFAALVTPKIIKRDQNRVDVIFEIKEDEPTIVRKIFFVGNERFSETKLETTIQTKETRWYRFFTNDDNYDRDRLAYDRELLRKFYLEHGYADFSVKSAVAELSPDQKEFFITFTLDEGQRYKFNNIAVTSSLPDVNAQSFESYLTFSKGQWYSSKEVERTITQITNALGTRGFAFVDVKPKINKDKEHLTVDINFEIQQGPKVYIDKIIIIGNERTDEEVIRREIRFFEGDPYNFNTVKMSERRLKGLGFFKKVDIKRQPSDAPDKVNIVIEVEEERTGEISLALGYSTTDGPGVDVKFAERNFRGKGNEIEVGTRFAKRNQEYNLYYQEPYFMDKELQASIRLFRITQKKSFEEVFDQKSLGTTLRLGYYLSDDITQEVHYTISQEEISNLNPNASKYIREIQGKALLSAVGQSISYDKRDNRFEPTEGYIFTLGNEYAGLGGQINYLKNKVSCGYYYPFTDDVQFQANAAVGNIMRVGRNLRVSDRMTLGGETLRGFDIGGVSPRDRTTLEALGGTKYYTATAEVTFPVGLPNEFNVRGAGFTDLGNVFDPGLPSGDVYDPHKLRLSVGFGIRWRSPMGPIRVDIAKPLLKDSKDKQRLLFVGFSTRF